MCFGAIRGVFFVYFQCIRTLKLIFAWHFAFLFQFALCCTILCSLKGQLNAEIAFLWIACVLKPHRAKSCRYRANEFSVKNRMLFINNLFLKPCPTHSRTHTTICRKYVLEKRPWLWLWTLRELWNFNNEKQATTTTRAKRRTLQLCKHTKNVKITIKIVET